MFKHNRAELSTVSRVSTSSGVLKPNWLDGELIKDWQNRLWGPTPLLPPYIHLTSLTWWVLAGLPHFRHSSTSVYYCQCKTQSKVGVGLGMKLHHIAKNCPTASLVLIQQPYIPLHTMYCKQNMVTTHGPYDNTCVPSLGKLGSIIESEYQDKLISY